MLGDFPLVPAARRDVLWISAPAYLQVWDFRQIYFSAYVSDGKNALFLKSLTTGSWRIEAFCGQGGMML